MLGVGQVGVVQNDSFRCVVSTAPEGFFRGFSTVIQTFEGVWGSQRNQQIVAKAMLHLSMSKNQRVEVHGAFLAHLDILGDKGIALGSAINDTFSAAKERKLIVDFLNQAHASYGADSADSMGIAEALIHAVESNRYQSENDARRLVELVQAVADRIGEAPVHYDSNGNVFVHPTLANELQKPGNEALSDLLQIGFRGAAPG